MKYISEIRKRFPELELRENEPMSRHCSFKIGGPVSAMALPSGLEQLSELCKHLNAAEITPLVIGNGTNLLVTDAALDRFVIKLGDGLSNLRQHGTAVFAQSGITLARLASLCAENSLGGLEFAHGIPGTLGGGVSMNAGAYGGEMKDVLRAVKYLDGAGQLREKRGGELGLGYRHRVFSGSDCIIVEAELELAPGFSDEIRGKMRELADKRRSSQPLDKPSAGSTFKRPVGGYAAALIEEAGLKGFSIGGAQVSEKHAGFVINRGNATFDEILALIEHIKKTVFDRAGIMLEPEVKIIR